ncbi:MAG: YifB family Mg chelatase-like AAA ATPase [Alphaproteobacteria bacterium]|uniref:YifB family Mg chelatase-like AAA ATPase n=1 Tax=Candidatus Nitrobium versatile TaxID=2884831 RepID=A0A953SHS1_9BACT|nr:YifB family Mg chelatase-like AAA ATPase [Candidatus Nitrobium versatile]
MLSRALSAYVMGIDAHLVEVEVDISAKGLPHFSMVGLPDAAVRESRDRIKAALKNIGFAFPLKQITVNLAPADLRKEGSSFDLPIAIGIIAAEEVLPLACLGEYLLAGELSLDGRIKPVKGALSIALEARKWGMKGLILPKENGAEAAVVSGIEVYSMKSLPEVVEFLGGIAKREPFTPDLETAMAEGSFYEEDFSEVKGQEHAKRALEVAAAGAHNLLMIGPPGSGKTMLSRRLPSILPPLTFEEALETTKIHSVAGLLGNGQSLLTHRPFRAPHHTVSDVALIGGGQIPRPGEVSLAHHGILFLDELPEFKRSVLEVLRQPLENGTVTVSRAAATVTFPAQFVLVAALNPCICGFYGDTRQQQCTCTPAMIHRYRSRISGPLMDRIDIHMDVPAVPYKELSGSCSGERSETIRQRVTEARERQLQRFGGERIFANGHMKTRHIKKYCTLSAEAHHLLDTAMQKLGLSARAYSRILKVARTIADLDRSGDIHGHHIAEAIQYRTLDRGQL